VIRKEIVDIINIQLKDNIKARILDNDGDNEYVNPGIKPNTLTGRNLQLPEK
jgi:polyphosphate kinase